VLKALHFKNIGMNEMSLMCLAPEDRITGEFIDCLKTKGLVISLDSSDDEENPLFFPKVILTEKGQIVAKTLVEGKGGESGMCR
jgi:hypothetical protein